jgi:hypothetical protein
MDTESNGDTLKEIKRAAIERKEEVKFRTIKVKLPVEMANQIQNAMLRDRYFITVSYSNNDESRLHHRYCRKNFSLQDALTAIDGLGKELLEEYAKEVQDESRSDG